MSNMKLWLRKEGISYKRLGIILGQSDSNISQKVNGNTAWQASDLLHLHELYGLSSDFILGISSKETIRERQGYRRRNADPGIEVQGRLCNNEMK